MLSIISSLESPNIAPRQENCGDALSRYPKGTFFGKTQIALKTLGQLLGPLLRLESLEY